MRCRGKGLLWAGKEEVEGGGRPGRFVDDSSIMLYSNVKASATLIKQLLATLD